MDQWTPAAEGRTFELPPILKPLEPFQKQLTIVSGLENKHGRRPRACAVSRNLVELRHRRARPRNLSAVSLPIKSPPSTSARTRRCLHSKWPPRPAASAAAPAIATTAAATAVPSRSARRPRRCRWKSTRASFSSGSSVRAIRRGAESAREAIRQHSRRGFRGGRRVSSETLGEQDRAMLGDYLETVREIERRVQKMEKQDTSHLNLPDVPLGIPPSFDDQLNLMFDIIALAYQANLTRVFTFMMAKEATRPDLQSHRRSRFLPRHLASSEPAEEARAAWKDSGLQHRGLRQVPDETGEDARRRRLHAGSLDHSLRQQHEQQQRAQPLPAADGDRRRRSAERSKAGSTSGIRTTRRWRTC